MLIHVKKDVTLHVKMTMPDSQRYPSDLYMINNVEDIIVSWGFKVFVSNNSNTFSVVETFLSNSYLTRKL